MRWILTAILLVLGASLTAVPALAQQPPSAFGGASDERPPSSFERPAPGDTDVGAPSAATPSLFARAYLWIAETQRELHLQLASAIRDLKNNWAFEAALVLVGLCFLYGVVHAAGPGHGKAVISSYVVANNETVRRAIGLSLAASVVQALSAIAIVAVLGLALRAAGADFKQTSSTLESLSYALIAVVGAWMLYRALRSRAWSADARVLAVGAPGGDALHVGHHAHEHDHDHTHHHNHAHTHAHGHNHGHAHGEACCGHSHIPSAQQLERDLSWREAAAIVLSVGIRPCTGAIIVLVFAMTHGLFWAGVGATFAMSIGTALTVSTLAVLAVGSKELALTIAGDGGRWGRLIQDAASIGGSALVLLLGATLFVASLGPARPF